jgi:hypothetical protein
LVNWNINLKAIDVVHRLKKAVDQKSSLSGTTYSIFKFEKPNDMTSFELQDYIHVYSMISFRDGKKEPGILINKYNLESATVQHFFIPQVNMQAYKNAFDRYDKETCYRLSIPVQVEDVLSVRPVSLADYKVIMQLLDERRQMLSY